MRDHAQRVDPAVGAPGGVHPHCLARYGMGGVLHRLLHGGAVVLALQAVKRPAVKFQGEGVAGHASRVPSDTGRPRSKSAVGMAGRPARCTCVGRSAPVPQAIVSLSSMVVPGSPLPSTIWAASTR